MLNYNTAAPQNFPHFKVALHGNRGIYTKHKCISNFEEMVFVLLAVLQIESLFENFVQSKLPQFKVAQMAEELIRQYKSWQNYDNNILCIKHSGGKPRQAILAAENIHLQIDPGDPYKLVLCISQKRPSNFTIINIPWHYSAHYDGNPDHAHSH